MPSDVLDQLEYSQGMVPDITHCLGVELHPFSIGDILLLKRIESPFLGYQPTLDYTTLREAVIICSNDFWRARSLLVSPSLKFLLSAWHARVSWFGIRSVNLISAYQTLFTHINKAYKFRPFPMPNSSSDGPDEMNSPTELTLLSALMERFHMPFDQAVNFSWSQAHWLYGAAAERTGCVSLSTPAGLKKAEETANANHNRIAQAMMEGKIRR